MALLFCDSFDHYTTVLQKWGNAYSSIGAFGRFGTSGLQDSSGATLTKTLPSSYGTLIIGAAVLLPNRNAGRIFSFHDTGSQQVELRVNSSGQLLVTRAGIGIGSTGTTVLNLSQFYYLEMKATIHNSTGVVVVRINGVTELNLTGQDTQNTANATVNQIVLGESAVNLFHQYDDLVVLDTSGGSPTNDFLGDVRVQSIFPDGNGNSSQLDGSDGNQTDNYLLVDETAPNSDTDYVESSDVGDKDTYTYGNVTPTTGTVFGVQILPFAKKTDAGVRSIVTVARHSGSEVDGPVQTLNSTYDYLEDIRETKPGGGAWSISDVNGAEFGVKVNA